MIKQCVKKPFTVLVAVIIALVLGVVCATRMTTDLLPEMELPYMIVITTYPGASPEKVEANVTEPLESALGTVSGVQNVLSSSAENYSMVILEFEDDTDMDSAMVKVSSALQEVEPYLPELSGTPNVMEISMDMMATMYVSASYDGKDIYELSDFVESTVVPYFERQDGVASVSALGLIEETIEVRLNQEKIDAINAQLLETVTEKLDEAKQEIDDALAELEDAQQALDDGQRELEEQQNSTANQLGEATLGLNQALATQSAYQAQLAGQQANQAALQMELQAYQDAGVVDSYEQLSQLFETLYDSVSGAEGYQAIYDQIYPQVWVALTQSTVDALADLGLTEAVTVTTENVDEVWDAMGEVRLPDDANQLEALLSIILGQTGVSLPSLSETQGALVSGLKGVLQTVAEQQSKQLAQEQADALSASVPTSVEDAIAHPEKLQNAVALLESQGMGEAAKNLTVENLTALSDIVNTRIPQIEAGLANLQTELLASTAALDAVNDAVAQAVNSYTEVEAGKILAAAGFGSAAAQLSAGQTALDDGRAQLESAQEAYENARETALNSANIDTLLELDTLSALIYAQNFSMPAGYIDDENDNQWLLKVGEEYDSVEALEAMVLCNLDGVGDVTLGSVADLTIIDNVGNSYTKVNGADGVVLSIFKSSTAGTNEVSKDCNEAIEELEEKYPGLHIQPLMDQGEYITIIIESILQSMIGGALLAILVLALFLKDVKPTLVVAFSIPFSVLVTLLLMYFTDISLNVMSMGGLGLAIGMLVDNSVVAIENIYRLRGRGLPAPRASVQGAKQVAGPIIASTLTTICVFLPMIFTTGYTRDLLFPLALTIGYALTASLVVALTVVPTVASTLLKNAKPKSHPWFDRMLEGYGRALDFCLRVKAVPLGVAVLLLAFSIFQVVQMGMVMIPDIDSNQIEIVVTMPEDTDKDTAYATADEVMERIMAVDGVDFVGAMTNTASLFTSAASGADDFIHFAFYVVPDEDVDTSKGIQTICDEITASTGDLDCTVNASASSSGEMSSMMGSGLEVNIYGSDIDTLLAISEDFMEIVNQVEGFEDASNGQEEGDETLILNIDKDEAMRLGLTVAQIYAEITDRLTTEKASTTLTVDGQELEVTIVNENALLTKENLMDVTFETSTMDEDGNTVTETHTLDEFSTVSTGKGVATVARENQQRYITVSASTLDGYNTTRLAQKVQEKLDSYEMPDGYSWEVGGEYENVMSMMTQMMEMLALGLLFIYLVMVAQFQSLLSPFIILFTVPLAFTGGLFGLLAFGEQLSLLSMIGFLVLMGTVVNNGIVFVDYVNQLRLGGMEKHDALIATGKTRMRPILMTALTTILAMCAMLFSTGIGASLSRGMAIVVAFGLAYATLMTLFVVPVMYDLLYRKQPKEIDVGDDTIDDAPDDAAEFIQQALAARQAEGEGAE